MKQMPRENVPLPSDIHSEKLILGEVLLENDSWKYAGVLLETDFSLDSHRVIFRAIKFLMDKGPVDIGLLANYLKGIRELEAIGNRPYLFELTEGIPRNCWILGHCEVLAEKGRLRRIMTVCNEAMQRAAAEDEEASRIVTWMGTEFRGIGKSK